VLTVSRLRAFCQEHCKGISFITPSPVHSYPFSPFFFIALKEKKNMQKMVIATSIGAKSGMYSVPLSNEASVLLPSKKYSNVIFYFEICY
jgi:hypothetical protein